MFVNCLDHNGFKYSVHCFLIFGHLATEIEETQAYNLRGSQTISSTVDLLIVIYNHIVTSL